MIEIPRAALIADKLAETAEFFSFGTNDLTQMTFGYSRDDAGSFLPEYVEKKILAKDPFESIDQEGVGQLVRLGTERGRGANPNLKVGVCGEHGGDPDSIRFFRSVRPQLRFLLAVSRAGRAAGGGAGGAGAAKRTKAKFLGVPRVPRSSSGHPSHAEELRGTPRNRGTPPRFRTLTSVTQPRAL